jgi:cellulose synthase/poly-beta-1,6-N-acetylglucosamine synthase-like glycosyltransferase
MKICAACIAAYDCAEFLPDLLKSLKSQIPLEGWEYDIRLGVDACPKTSAYLTRKKIRHYMAVKNVGHLILRNALIYLRPADVYIYFDADDFMLPEYVKKNIQAAMKYKLVMPKKINVNEKLQNHKNRGPVIENGGAMTFTHDVLAAVGGFSPYRCAGDTDLMRRAEMAGYKIHVIDEALYLRRAHKKCLTKAVITRIGSQYRKQVWAKMCADRAKGVVKIKPEKVGLKEI